MCPKTALRRDMTARARKAPDSTMIRGCLIAIIAALPTSQLPNEICKSAVVLRPLIMRMVSSTYSRKVLSPISETVQRDSESVESLQSFEHTITYPQ